MLPHPGPPTYYNIRTIHHIAVNYSLTLLKMGKHCPKHFELIHRSIKLLLLHLVGHLYYSPTFMMHGQTQIKSIFLPLPSPSLVVSDELLGNSYTNYCLYAWTRVHMRICLALLKFFVTFSLSVSVINYDNLIVELRFLILTGNHVSSSLYMIILGSL